MTPAGADHLAWLAKQLGMTEAQAAEWAVERCGLSISAANTGRKKSSTSVKRTDFTWRLGH